ncbi:large ribosomal subunit protein bL21m-like [Lepus europaeus]|uniref:large ribosomal subunit protein bL21m-like n=1 Tax=Lepus europaeus TaxID=9983 RepID=UPI002B488A64|nr:large ribosomal subunit protein bL21m-like [Lepus europaeus]
MCNAAVSMAAAPALLGTPGNESPVYFLQVLLVGADGFTLLGRPLLGKDLVRVEATVIEKTESWPKINMKFRKRKNFKKKKITVSPQTVLRINTVEVAPCLL